VVKNGDNGDIACDSYHRYKEDAALMRRLNLNAYRYSIAWPRIQPNGSGPVNQKGLDHYKRVTDAILEANVRPLVTLYHWDIPQALVDKGAWANRDMVARFTEDAGIMAHALADRVGQWSLFNEHKAATGFGYLPLYKEPCGNDPYKFLKAAHVINLAQGESFRLLKSINPALRVGSMYDVSPMYPASESVADQAAAERFHRLQNLWFLKPPLAGQYPEGVLPPERIHDLLGFRSGDEAQVTRRALIAVDAKQRGLPQLSIAPFCCTHCVTPALGMIPGMRYCCTTTSTTSKIVSTMLCTKVRANTTPSWPFSLVTETPVAIF
jgi:beta-glucosidase